MVLQTWFPVRGELPFLFWAGKENLVSISHATKRCDATRFRDERGGRKQADPYSVTTDARRNRADRRGVRGTSLSGCSKTCHPIRVICALLR
jgi:hypothetical protein